MFDKTGSVSLVFDPDKDIAGWKREYDGTFSDNTVKIILHLTLICNNADIREKG